MKRHHCNFVLAYQGADDARRDGKEQFWAAVAGWLAYCVVWGGFALLIAAVLGSLLLWIVLGVHAAK